MEEPGYGKSPEWVEVDGLIVSRNHVAGNSSLSNTLNRTSTPMGGAPLPGPRRLNSIPPVAGGSHGSVLSLPYSSRTQLTYNGSSTSGTTQRSSARSSSDNENPSLQRPKTLMRSRQLAVDEADHDDIIEDEPPYETIPSVPPSVNITANSLEFSDVILRADYHESSGEAATISSYIQRRPPQPPPPPSEPEEPEEVVEEGVEPDSLIHPQDDSVTSAHDLHTGIYDIISKLPQQHSLDAAGIGPGGYPKSVHVLDGGRPQTASIDAVQGYFFRKKLLMQDANETRL